MPNSEGSVRSGSFTMPDSQNDIDLKETFENSLDQYFRFFMNRDPLTKAQEQLWKKIKNYYHQYDVRNMFKSQIEMKFCQSEEFRSLINKGYMEQKQFEMGTILKILI